MSGLINVNGAAAVTSPSTLSRLKGVVRAELGVAADVPVVIHEAACTEPGCAPVETLIAVLDGSDRTFRLTQPLIDVSPEDLRRLFREEHNHELDH
jgi:hypothetical protein